jgi:organic radical activating enzyme
MQSRDYYCRNKFTFLKIDAEQQVTYNCHAATPHRINVEWLRNNPGQLFNTDVNVSERQMMLNNQRNSSCEQNCYRAEDVGGAAPRILEGGAHRTHTEVIAQPETIDFTISSECNLACSYCCREFSSTWRSDLEKNGSYTDLGARYELGTKDLVLKTVSQRQRKATEAAELIAHELTLASPFLQQLIITGGEPFLNNSLLDLINNNSQIKKIKVFTSLGVNPVRFKHMLSQIQHQKNVVVSVSAENIGPLHEFNRNGSLWTEFETNLDHLRSSGIPFIFHSTLTNLTIHGFVDFYAKFKDHSIEFDLAHQPNFMPAYVIDPDSKNCIIDQLLKLNFKNCEHMIKTLQVDPIDKQRIDTRNFLVQFAQRRTNASLKVFPNGFLKWLDINVV